ncbi:hypothetical protein DAPPUDRAFT_326912 [Daphnia pulex]|uniref:Uncharacterized protein n=1 Tax=Daphnia pulex TaxID=6669 RepID=E9H957_DAPPU|nr:hypothetical protein DAPPUDRAFT_326912 [Daphnia pulex]|eukprot:EFX71732.1 hypothetical protein DAPPUDRAFT_326912 [Daphnia pulex]
MWKMSKHTLYSFCLIYEKHLKYREASDDEVSDKEDTPVVESCILVETLMLVLETTPVMFLENLKHQVYLHLMLNLCLVSPLDLGFLNLLPEFAFNWIVCNYTMDYYRKVPKHTSVGASFMRNTSTSDDEDSDKEDTVVESSEGELSCGDPDVESGNEGKGDFSEECEEGERKRKKALRTKEAKKAKLALEANLEANSDEDSDLSSAFSDCSLDEDDDE